MLKHGSESWTANLGDTSKRGAMLEKPQVSRFPKFSRRIERRSRHVADGLCTTKN